MFTGLVREVGEAVSLVRGRSGSRLTVRCPKTAPALSHGDSVAVNGACLTCEEVTQDGFTASILQATLDATNLGGLAKSDRVNLEPALKAGDEIGGHFLQGHVDCAVAVTANGAAGSGDWMLTCELPEELAAMVFPGASVGLNGVSLTVRSAEAGMLAVNLIPATLEDTNLGTLKPSDRVNLEVDLIVKSVYYALAHLGEGRELTLEDLARFGYGTR
jgi:riboflavin synthase